jgi:hypothetical protein
MINNNNIYQLSVKKIPLYVTKCMYVIGYDIVQEHKLTHLRPCPTHGAIFPLPTMFFKLSVHVKGIPGYVYAKL